jgi:hypothetical protein
MTTLVRPPGAPRGIVETSVSLASVGARLLVGRLREEAERQIAFSEAKVLFREAASAIERLDAELTRARADLERTERHAL